MYINIIYSYHHREYGQSVEQREGSMDGWMDGWINGWVNEGSEGVLGGWMEDRNDGGRMDGKSDRPTGNE